MSNILDHHARAFRNAAKLMESNKGAFKEGAALARMLTYLAVSYQDEANKFAIEHGDDHGSKNKRNRLRGVGGARG